MKEWKYSLQLENKQREKLGTQQSLFIQQETNNKENERKNWVKRKHRR